MATTLEQLKELQRKVQRLETQNAETRRVLRERGILPADKRAAARKGTLSERERVREILRSAGMLAELTPEEKARAARWRALPEEEKKRIQDEFFNLKLAKPLSDIIIENRR
jgi:hypothetical protein